MIVHTGGHRRTGDRESRGTSGDHLGGAGTRDGGRGHGMEGGAPCLELGQMKRARSAPWTGARHGRRCSMSWKPSDQRERRSVTPPVTPHREGQAAAGSGHPDVTGGLDGSCCRHEASGTKAGLTRVFQEKGRGDADTRAVRFEKQRRNGPAARHGARGPRRFLLSRGM